MPGNGGGDKAARQVRWWCKADVVPPASASHGTAISDKTDACAQAVVHLDPDHAIVLFEFLSERSATEGASATTAETVVLDAVFGQLERQLSAPFRADYADLLSAARARLTPLDDA